MMRKLFAMAALLLALAACGDNKDNPENGSGGGSTNTKVSVTGIWELASVSTKATVGSVNVNVYIDFASDGSFSLYQKIGEGRYTLFTGTYSLSADNQLSGKYASGSSWGPYSAAMSGSNLTLTSAGGKETDTYKKISAIPESVLKNLN